MWSELKTLAAATAVLATLSMPASAQSIVSSGQSFVQGRLLPGAQLDDGARLAGLRLSMADGWKTYWRSPGDAGIPPNFDWSDSQNVAAVEVMWPRPGVFESFGMMTIGYETQVVLPLRITPADPAAAMHVALTAELGVCKEICVLERFDLSSDIMPDDRPVGAKQIDRALARVPGAAADLGLQRAECRIVGDGKKREFHLQIGFAADLANPFVVLEGGNGVWLSRIQTTQTAPGDLTVSADLGLSEGVNWVNRSDFRTTVLADGFAADVQGCAAPAG
ncbi:MAG: protein-disulfide reductase DsbD domain-containing protein [Pseudomonadota bacterium]